MLELVPWAVEVRVRLAERESEGQEEADAEPLPGARLALGVERGPEALALREWEGDMVSLALVEGERVGRAGEAEESPVGAAV